MTILHGMYIVIYIVQLKVVIESFNHPDGVCTEQVDVVNPIPMNHITDAASNQPCTDIFSLGQWMQKFFGYLPNMGFIKFTVHDYI